MISFILQEGSGFLNQFRSIFFNDEVVIQEREAVFLLRNYFQSQSFQIIIYALLLKRMASLSVLMMLMN